MKEGKMKQRRNYKKRANTEYSRVNRNGQRINPSQRKGNTRRNEYY